MHQLCVMLRSARDLEAAAVGHWTARDVAVQLAEGLDPLPAYADCHLVRLDVGTGVCVLAREVGGPTDGQGHELVVLEVAS